MSHGHNSTFFIVFMMRIKLRKLTQVHYSHTVDDTKNLIYVI